MARKDPLAVGEIYHIFSRSIAEYRIFNNAIEFQRMIEAVRFYQFKELPFKFSYFAYLVKREGIGFNAQLQRLLGKKDRSVEIIAYCLMPTHIHLILKQLQESGISIYLKRLLDSYTRYFNIRHKRKGPLWESRFNNVLVKTDEQLLHLTRYIHINPTTAHLIEKPEEWQFSSYREYLGKVNEEDRICQYQELLKIDPVSYQKFVNDRVDYQKDLAKIKGLIIEEQE